VVTGVAVTDDDGEVTGVLVGETPGAAAVVREEAVVVPEAAEVGVDVAVPAVPDDGEVVLVGVAVAIGVLVIVPVEASPVPAICVLVAVGVAVEVAVAVGELVAVGFSVGVAVGVGVLVGALPPARVQSGAAPLPTDQASGILPPPLLGWPSTVRTVQYPPSGNEPDSEAYVLTDATNTREALATAVPEFPPR
jgi:hypothetical protein